MQSFYETDHQAAFEQILFNNLKEVSLHAKTDLLYWCGKERKGSSFLIGTLVEEIEALAEEAGDMDSDLLASIVVSLNMAGRAGTAARQFVKASKAKQMEMDPQVYKLVQQAASQL
jgi:hypothetical protein